MERLQHIQSSADDKQTQMMPDDLSLVNQHRDKEPHVFLGGNLKSTGESSSYISPR